MRENERMKENKRRRREREKRAEHKRREVRTHKGYQKVLMRHVREPFDQLRQRNGKEVVVFFFCVRGGVQARGKKGIIAFHELYLNFLFATSLRSLSWRQKKNVNPCPPVLMTFLARKKTRNLDSQKIQLPLFAIPSLPFPSPWRGKHLKRQGVRVELFLLWVHERS